MKKTKRVKRAIGYVCDIPVPDTDLVISKDDQRLRLMKCAEKEDLELIRIYEDEALDEAFINRPGVQKILNDREDFDVLLVERVWCMSQKMSELNPFLEKLNQKNIQFVASSYLWDDTSQAVRHFNLVLKLRRDKKAQADAEIKERAA
jgi:DNA invertase Pin-like site-specific DNA recombinase